MTVQIRNDQAVDLLAGDYQPRYEPNFALANAASTFMLLPQLRGLWLYSSVDNANSVYDASGQGRTVAPGTAPTFGVDGLIPYAAFSLAGSQYLTRADEAGLDITGAITIITWVKFAAGSTGALTGIVSKWLAAGNQRSFVLNKLATNEILWSTSSLGTAASVANIGDGAANYTTSYWLYVACRFRPAVAMDMFIGNNQTWNTYTGATANAAIFNSTTALDIGRYDAANYFDGNLAISALCATNHSDSVIRNAWEQTRAGFGV